MEAFNIKWKAGIREDDWMKKKKKIGKHLYDFFYVLRLLLRCFRNYFYIEFVFDIFFSFKFYAKGSGASYSEIIIVRNG